MICEVALVLLMDASTSISAREWNTQREGHAEAMRAPAVRSIIDRDGLAVAVVQFADVAETVMGWQVLRSSDDALAYAGALDAMPRALSGGTRTGDALEHALGLIGGAPCGDRLVIDLVTDGETFGGTPVEGQRDLAFARGVRVNALVVRDGADWARRSAVTPGGFVIEIDGWSQFVPAMRRKLVMELGAR